MCVVLCSRCKGRFFTGAEPLLISRRWVAFARPLERPLFVARCKALKSSLKPSLFHGNVYNISGKVRFSDSDQLVEVTYSTVSGSLSIVPVDGRELMTPESKTIKATSCFLVFDGVGLIEDGLKDWLRLCAKQSPAKKTKKTKVNMTPQEINHIHEARHLDQLPPGFFYNGYQYVNFFGEKRNLHPNIDQFIDEYITEVNQEIERFNRELDLHKQPDLFDP